MFWNKGGLGWSIGKKAYLMSGSYWHKSEFTLFFSGPIILFVGGLNTGEPWEGPWSEGVKVECYSSCSSAAWSECSVSCGKGIQSRTGCKRETEIRSCIQKPCPSNFKYITVDICNAFAPKTQLCVFGHHGVSGVAAALLVVLEHRKDSAFSW